MSDVQRLLNTVWDTYSCSR